MEPPVTGVGPPCLSVTSSPLVTPADALLPDGVPFTGSSGRELGVALLSLVGHMAGFWEEGPGVPRAGGRGAPTHPGGRWSTTEAAGRVCPRHVPCHVDSVLMVTAAKSSGCTGVAKRTGFVWQVSQLVFSDLFR